MNARVFCAAFGSLCYLPFRGVAIHLMCCQPSAKRILLDIQGKKKQKKLKWSNNRKRGKQFAL